jgi:hypothetical protein
MRSQLNVLAATLVLGAAAVWGPRGLDVMSDLQTFRIAEVDVRGAQVLVEDSVVAQMRLGQFASVWGDRDVLADRLTRHPLIRTARVHRRLPNGLRVEIEERQPIALAATPTLEPVDAEGVRLPIDPTRYRLDLPIISATTLPPADAAVFPAEVRSLAAEIEHLWETDLDFYQRISTIRRAADGSFVVRLMSPEVEVVLPSAVPVGRLQEAKAALEHAIRSEPADLPSAVDLRFVDQVVVRRDR